MGKGTNTTTNQTTTAPSAQAAGAYSSVLNQAQGVAATPYQSYGGELVAPFNPEQNQGVSGVNQFATAAQPAINQALTQTQANSQPLTATQIQQYESPYTQSVVNATQAQFNNQNQQQQQGVVGNAIAQGALGGNRSAIAQAETANQEQLAQAPVIAGLQNQGYAQAVQTAQQQQQTGLQGAAQTGNLGVAGQTAGLTGAGTQLSAGAQQQATQQAQDAALYQQFQNQQAYPFQTTQWLAGLDTGVGSQMGGTSSGTTTAPAPSTAGQIAGGITSGVGALGATGAFGSAGWMLPALAALARGGVAQLEDEIKRAHGGVVNGVAGFADGGAVQSDEDPQGVSAGQHYAAASDYQIKPNQDGTHSVLNVRTGQIHFTGTPSGAQNAQASLIYRNRASGGAVHGYADGGWTSGVAGVPYSGAKGYIPTNSISHGSGAPHASAPAAYQPPQNNLTNQAASIGQLAKTITDANNSKNPGVAGTAVAGDVGPSSYGGANGPTPLVGGPSGVMSFNSGDGIYARGGKVRGYADGGVAPLPNADDNMFLAKPADEKIIRAKRVLADGLRKPLDVSVGKIGASMQDDDIRGTRLRGYADGGDPTFDDRFNAAFPSQGVAPAPDDSVVNPGDPIRMDPDADEKWRKGKPIPPLGTEPPPKPDDDSLPDAPTDGIAPSTALAYTNDSNRRHSHGDLPPEVTTGSSNGIAPADVRAANEPKASAPNGIDWGGNSKLWPSLMSAGFGMMASRSPFLGNAIGEGGQAGMAQYGSEVKAEQEARQHAEQLQLERERLEKPYSEMTANEKAADARAKQAQQGTQINQAVIMGPDGKPMTNPAYVAATQAVQKDWQPKLMKIGVNARGDDVMGVYDPNTKRATDVNGNPMTITNGVVQPASPKMVTPSGNPEPQSSIDTKPAGSTASNSPYAPVASADGQVPLSLQKVQAAAGYQTPPSAPHEYDPSAPAGSEASRDTKFLSGIADQDPGYALAIKKAADYELDPGKYASMIKGHRERFMNDVMRYDPNYNPQQVGLIYKAQAAFLPGTKTGDTVRSFNTAVSHLDTLKEAYKAVNNGDWQAFNKLKNTFQTQFGYAPPNTLNGIAQIVGGEVVKATVGSQNALGDREELRKTLDRDLSSMQATDVIDKYQSLMGGQLHSLKFAYEQGTHLHNFDEKYLLPRSREVLKHIDAEAQPATKPSLSDFLERAQAANPHATKEDLTTYYNKKYGTQ